MAIACLNEELAISGIVLRAKRHSSEVLVVDDGSTDRTAENAHFAGARVVQHPRNLGKGAAIQTAFRYAATNGFDVLVLLDGDGQHDADEIPLVLAPIVREEQVVDIAFGFRFGPNTEMPIYRRVGKRVLDYATSAAANGHVTDSQCGFRAFGPAAIKLLAFQLHAERFAIESEMVAVANDHGLTTENVPIHCRYEGLDGSTERPVKHAAGVLNHVISMITMRRPLLAIGVPGGLLLLGGAFYLIRLLQIYNQTGVFLMAYALAAAGLAILGAILVATSLMLNVFLLVRRAMRAAE